MHILWHTSLEKPIKAVYCWNPLNSAFCLPPFTYLEHISDWTLNLHNGKMLVYLQNLFPMVPNYFSNDTADCGKCQWLLEQSIDIEMVLDWGGKSDGFSKGIWYRGPSSLLSVESTQHPAPIPTHHMKNYPPVAEEGFRAPLLIFRGFINHML